MAERTDTLRGRLTEAVRTTGGWSTVHLDLSGDRENPEGLAESRRRSVRDRLARQGADDATVAAIDAALLGILSEPLGGVRPLPLNGLYASGVVRLIWRWSSVWLMPSERSRTRASE